MTDRVELLVVGGGPAGVSAAGGYRGAGGEGVVAIVTDEHRMPYQRPPLTKERGSELIKEGAAWRG